jgi:hypothetical protein
MQPHAAAPRHFVSSPGLPGVGLPSDRLARIAARRAFVVLKNSFHEAVSDLDGAQAEWLRGQVRAAEEPTDLLLLRAPVFAALADGGLEHRQRRHALRRGLSVLFPSIETGPASGFAAF